jgi:hypothetical protein
MLLPICNNFTSLFLCEDVRVDDGAAAVQARPNGEDGAPVGCSGAARADVAVRHLRVGTGRTSLPDHGNGFARDLLPGCGRGRRPPSGRPRFRRRARLLRTDRRGQQPASGGRRVDGARDPRAAPGRVAARGALRGADPARYADRRRRRSPKARPAVSSCAEPFVADLSLRGLARFDHGGAPVRATPLCNVDCPRRVMRSRRDCGAMGARPWSWRAATAAGVIAAVSGAGCATDPPPRPAQIDPSNAGAPESTPLDIGSGVPVVMPAEVRSPAPPADGSADDLGRDAAPPGQGHQGHEQAPEDASPQRPHPEHHHEPAGGGAP